MRQQRRGSSRRVVRLALLLGAAAVGAALLASEPASAQFLAAKTTAPVTLRARPSASATVVAHAPAGKPVFLDGCIRAWCFVHVGAVPGWVPARDLVAYWGGRALPISSWTIQQALLADAQVVASPVWFPFGPVGLLTGHIVDLGAKATAGLVGTLTPIRGYPNAPIP